MSKKERTIANYEALAQTVNIAYNAVVKAITQADHVTPKGSRPAVNLRHAYELLSIVKDELETEMYNHVPAEALEAANYGNPAARSLADPVWMISPFYPGQKDARFPHLAAVLGELEAIEQERLEAERRARAQG